MESFAKAAIAAAPVMAAPLMARRPRPALTVGFFNFVVKQQIPVVAAQTLLIAEIIRKIPVDYRMGSRAKERGRLNVSELLYFSIKSFALVAVILDCVLQESTAITSGEACKAASGASTFLWYTSSTLVAAAVAWRTYIIFGRSAIALRLLLIGLLMQFTVTIAAVCKTHKFLVINDGYCDYDPHQFADLKRPWYQLAAPWFVFVNFLFDMSMVGASTWKIVSAAKSPLGFSGLARVLILNGVQYAVLVCTTNFIEFILIATASHKIPSLLNLSITIQIITGLNLIAEEQDAVHGYTRSHLLTSTKRRGYGTDNTPLTSPPKNRTMMTRDTGSMSAFGTGTTQHDYKEGMYSSTVGEDSGVVNMHTSVDVEVDSDRSDQKSAQSPAENGATAPTVAWEITMDAPVRRKPPPSSLGRTLTPKPSSASRNSVAFSPTTGERPRTAPSGGAPVSPLSGVSGGGGGGENIEMQGRERPTTSLANHVGIERTDSVSGSVYGSSSVQQQRPPLSSASESTPIPPTPMTGVSIRSIRQALERNTNGEVPTYTRPDSTLEGFPPHSQWPSRP
ncbi:hypothetical protein CF327_g953 [Tilletia walkeri]|nr:hypothetical protein CF327_g953 [Tilletia walkeri]